MNIRALGISILTSIVFLHSQTALAETVTPAAPIAPALSENPGPKLVRVSPLGDDVPAERQIVLEFNVPIAPVGRMERDEKEIPFKFEPAVACEWRWLNTTRLACQLKQETALKRSTAYSLTLKETSGSPESELLSAAGKTFLEERKQADIKNPGVLFTTIRPIAEFATLNEWSAPDFPTLTVTFNQPVTAESVKKILKFEVGMRRKVAPELIEPEKNTAGTEWKIRPAESLGLNHHVELTVSPGIVPREGGQSGVEEKTIVEFYTFPKFKFLGVRCCPANVPADDCWNEDNRELIEPGSDTKGPGGEKAPDDDSRCNPQRPMVMEFSSPVALEDIKSALSIAPDPLKGKGSADIWADVYVNDEVLSESREEDQTYSVSLPYGLKAYTKYYISAAAAKLKDRFGRPLDKDIDLHFYTAHRQARMVFDNRISVLEKNVASHLPVAVQNLDSLKLTYQTYVTGKGVESATKDIAVDNVPDLSYYFPIKIRDILGGRSGVVLGNLDAKLPVKNEEYEDNFLLSVVTPYEVHVKLGHFNTLVWVTRFSDGSPVQGAKVGLYSGMMNDLEVSSKFSTEGVTDKNGLVTLAGTAEIDPKSQTRRWWSKSSPGPVLKALITKDDDLAYVPLVYDVRVANEGANGTYIPSDEEPAFGHMRVWGTTPQGVYKLGEKVQYKIFVRNQDVQGLVKAPAGNYSIKVIDPTENVVGEFKDLKLSEFGAISGEVPIPAESPVGWYRFMLSSDFAPSQYSYNSEDNHRTWEAMRVLVTDFTPAAFKVSTDLKGEQFKNDDTVNSSVGAALHSGGPYGSASCRVTAKIVSSSLDNLSPALSQFTFSTSETENESEQVIFSQESTLDQNGQMSFTFPAKSDSIVAGRLEVEGAVRDDRGKFIANSKSARFRGRDRYVGLNFGEWMYPKGAAIAVQGVVVDENGKAVEGTNVHFSIKHQVTKASRVKGAGDAYLTHYETVMEESSACDLNSQKEPINCRFTPTEPGLYQVDASIKDTKGREHNSRVSTYVVGSGEMIWESDTGNRLDVISESSTYKVGDEAKFLIKNPYPGARALVTIERYGVIKSWFETLEGNTPVIKVPITENLIPGFYLSVTVVSPRVDKPISEDQVDLGKPTMKMGYARIEVKDQRKELIVTPKTEREVYKPRDTVRAMVSVKTHQGDVPPVELAVAVLDEAVYDLIASGKSYFDPYAGFYQLSGLDLSNFNLLLQLVGRRKFERKGANSGGDGAGFDFNSRDLFKFVSYWNPALPVDSSGNAKFSFEVPDNLTGWRILAMGVTSTDRMGLGWSSFKVNQPTEIRAALPNQVVEGDEFQAGFTVMNRSDKPRKLKVVINASGPIEGETTVTKEVAADPYARVPVEIPIKTSKNGEIKFVIQASDAQDGDKLSVTLPVNKRVSMETAATYGTADSDSVSEKYSFPKDIRTDVGSVNVVLSPSVISSVDGAFRYMSNYPYLCWEQRLTKAVFAMQYAKLKQYISDSFSWKDSEGIPDQTLSDAASFQAPSGGMTYFVAQDEYVDPYLSAYTALAFNWLAKAGHKVNEKVAEKLDEYLLKILKQDVLPTFYSSGMSATTRAVAINALAQRGKITLPDLMRHIDHVSDMTLFGMANMLSALTTFPDTEITQQMLLDKIYSHANETGGKFMFSDTIVTVDYARILATPLRDNCAILSSFIAHNKYYKAKGLAPAYGGDVPFKLMRTITQTRKNRDHWENTQENLFCMNALSEFSEEYEATKPAATWTAQLNGKPFGQAQFKDLRDKPVEVTRPLTSEDPGTSAELLLNRKGVGRVYYAARLTYSPSDLKTSAINSGMELTREYSVERDGKWQMLQNPFQLKRGELIKVDLFLSLPAPRNFVVVADPVPGGLEPVNRDLATSSSVDADKAEMQFAGGSHWFRFHDWIDFATDRYSFYHQELRHDEVRFYSDYLPAGNYHLSYTAQAISPGTFSAQPARSEEMYDPDVFGKSEPGRLVVGGIN